MTSLIEIWEWIRNIYVKSKPRPQVNLSLEWPEVKQSKWLEINFSAGPLDGVWEKTLR